MFVRYFVLCRDRWRRFRKVLKIIDKTFSEMVLRDFPKELGTAKTRLYLGRQAARRSECLGKQIGRVQTEWVDKWLYRALG